MEMVRLLLVCAAISMVASAAEFSLSVGPPVAATAPAATSSGATPQIEKKKAGKDALFAVRLEECEALDKAQISGTADGLVNGARTAPAAVTITTAGPPGVYIVSQDWNLARGLWVVSLSAACGSAKAGAIVPIGPSGDFQRDGTKILAHTPSKAEIDAALKALEGQAR